MVNGASIDCFPVWLPSTRRVTEAFLVGSPETAQQNSRRRWIAVLELSTFTIVDRRAGNDTAFAFRFCCFRVYGTALASCVCCFRILKDSAFLCGLPELKPPVRDAIAAGAVAVLIVNTNPGGPPGELSALNVSSAPTVIHSSLLPVRCQVPPAWRTASGSYAAASRQAPAIHIATASAHAAAAIPPGRTQRGADRHPDRGGPSRRPRRVARPGHNSRPRDCHSAAPPSFPLVGVSMETMRECQQNDSLADGQAATVDLLEVRGRYEVRETITAISLGAAFRVVTAFHCLAPPFLCNHMCISCTAVPQARPHKSINTQLVPHERRSSVNPNRLSLCIITAFHGLQQ